MSTTPPLWKHQKHAHSTAFAMKKIFDQIFYSPRHLHLGDAGDAFAQRVSCLIVVHQHQDLFHRLCTTTQPRISNLFQMDVCALCVRYYIHTINPEYQPDGCVRTLRVLLHTINPEYQPDGCVRTLCALLHTYNQPRISNLFQMDVCALCVRYYIHTINPVYQPDGCVRTLCAQHTFNQLRISNLFQMDVCVTTT